MTVEELVAKLLALNTPKHTVVLDLHSEFTEATTVQLMTGVEHGGYVSRSYKNAAGKLDVRAKGYVHIGYGI